MVMSNAYYTEPIGKLHTLSTTYCRSLGSDDWEKILRFKQQMVSYIAKTGFNTRCVMMSRFLYFTSLIDYHYLQFLEHSKQSMNNIAYSQFSHLIDELIDKYSNRFEDDEDDE